jgi:uncharacterized protein with HEPN domain
MRNTDVQRIVHIKKYCDAIKKTIERFGNSFEIFDADDDYYNAVSMRIYQIGELSIGLTDDFKAGAGKRIEWHKIRGMRNIFAHSYHTMSKQAIWQTAIENIPFLLDFCNKIIEENKDAFTPPPRPKEL